MTTAMKRVFIAACALAASLSFFTAFTIADESKARKKTAEVLAKEISRLRFQNLYVADFLDSSGRRTEEGCYFSSVFSYYLKGLLKDADVVNRIDAQRLLDHAGVSGVDAQKPEDMPKFKTVLNADVILTGLIRFAGDKYEMLLSLREVSTAKELIQAQYREKLEPPFKALFPPATDASGRIFYFANMDGVISPRCKHCPQPEFTAQARATGVSGTALFSVLVAQDGTAHQIRLVQSVEPSLDQASIDIMHTWVFEPARNYVGNPVPVRVVVEVAYHRF